MGIEHRMLTTVCTEEDWRAIGSGECIDWVYFVGGQIGEQRLIMWNKWEFETRGFLN